MNLCMPKTRNASSLAARPKLLMVTHRVPYPPNKGERIRSWNLLKRLTAHYDIYLAALADRTVSYQVWQTLHEHTTDLALAPTSAISRGIGAVRSAINGRCFTEGAFAHEQLTDAINRWTAQHKFDAALAVCSSTAQYVQHLPIPLKVLDLVDVDSRKWADYARASHGVNRWIYSTEAKRLAEYERTLADQFNQVLVTTNAEAKLYRRIAPNAEVTIVPNGVDFEYFTPQIHPHQPVAVFTGVLNYKPNVEGLDWLLRRVWPNVLRRVPQAELRIVGREPSRKVRRMDSVPGVEVIGPVDDVRPHLAEASVSLAPLHIARGIQNKILEAMAMSRPVVTTHHAAKAVGARSGRHLYAIDHPDAWTEAIVHLFADATTAQRIGTAARQFVMQYHDWNDCTARMTQTLEQNSKTIRAEVLAATKSLVRAA